MVKLDAQSRIDEADARPDVVEMHKLRAQLSRTRRENRALLHRAQDAEERLDVILGLDAPSGPPKPIARRETSSGLREATPVVVCSDWHVEEDVAAGRVVGGHVYNPEIAESRIDRLAQAIVAETQAKRQRFAIRDMILGLQGDMITGYIHEELEETNHMSPVEAVDWLEDRILAMLLYVADELDMARIIVPCIVGNHGRTTKKKRIKTSVKNSYEWLLYSHLRRALRGDERFEFVVAGGSMLCLDTYGYVTRHHHGDEFRYQGGVGGFQIPLMKAKAKWDSHRPAHCDVFGHYHTYQCTPGWTSNGSLIGVSEFAQNFHKEDPVQAFFLVDSKRGKCQSTPLWVT